jgi:hypothetical protein
MLYKVGTKKEVLELLKHLPDRVLTEVFQGVVVLDAEYGEDRNYLESGGYSIIAENTEDVSKVAEIISKNHPCEWATRISNTGWTSVLYIINDDFSIMVYAPENILPSKLINELED